MTMYKKATKEKLRFQTKVGLVPVEKLWELSLEDLDKLAISLEKKCKSSSKSFLDTKTEEDKTSKLRFEIVLDVLNTKLEEVKAQQEAVAKKRFNQKVMEAISEKKESELKNKSVEELEAMLKK